MRVTKASFLLYSRPKQHLLLFPAITKGFLPYIDAIFMEIVAKINRILWQCFILWVWTSLTWHYWSGFRFKPISGISADILSSIWQPRLKRISFSSRVN